MHSVAVAAALVALFTGATAAPITAYLRIDTPEVVLFPFGDRAEYIGAWYQDEFLSRVAQDIEQDDASNADETMLASLTGLQGPPAVVMSASGIGLGTLLFWRRRRHVRRKRQRRRTRTELRQMAAVL